MQEAKQYAELQQASVSGRRPKLVAHPGPKSASGASHQAAPTKARKSTKQQKTKPKSSPLLESEWVVGFMAGALLI